MSTARLQRMLDNREAILIDVRTQAEFDAGHIAGAVHCHHEDIPGCLEPLPQDPSVPVVVYCTAGVRSFWALRKLRALGYKSVYNYAGGVKRWERSGRPLLTE